MKVEVLYVGLQHPKVFPGTLEAMEHVVEQDRQGNFMIKTHQNGSWEDGAKLLKGFQRMFEPVES